MKRLFFMLTVCLLAVCLAVPVMAGAAAAGKRRDCELAR